MCALQILEKLKNEFEGFGQTGSWIKSSSYMTDNTSLHTNSHKEGDGINGVDCSPQPSLNLPI